VVRRTATKILRGATSDEDMVMHFVGDMKSGSRDERHEQRQSDIDDKTSRQNHIQEAKSTKGSQGSAPWRFA
jgi:hypothetical protein